MVLVSNARAPIINAHPTPAVTNIVLNEMAPPTYTVDAVLDPMQPGGTLTYQWYSATGATGTGTAISGATNNSYTPAPTSTGDTWYYAAVTNTNSGLPGTPTAVVTSNRVQLTVVSSVTSIRIGKAPSNWASTTSAGLGVLDGDNAAVRQTASTRGSISLLAIEGNSQAASGNTIEVTLANPASKVSAIGFMTSAGNAAATLTSFGASNVSVITGTSGTFTVTTSAAIPSAADTYLFVQVQPEVGAKRWYQLAIAVVVPGPDVAYYDPGNDRIVHIKPILRQGQRASAVSSGNMYITPSSNIVTFARVNPPTGSTTNIYANYEFPTIEGQNYSDYKTFELKYTLTAEGALGSRGDNMIRTFRMNTTADYGETGIFKEDGTAAPVGYYHLTSGNPAAGYPDLKRASPGWGESQVPLVEGTKGSLKFEVASGNYAGVSLGYNDSNVSNRAESFTVTIDEVIFTKE